MSFLQSGSSWPSSLRQTIAVCWLCTLILSLSLSVCLSVSLPLLTHQSIDIHFYRRIRQCRCHDERWRHLNVFLSGIFFHFLPFQLSIQLFIVYFPSPMCSLTLHLLRLADSQTCGKGQVPVCWSWWLAPCNASPGCSEKWPCSIGAHALYMSDWGAHESGLNSFVGVWMWIYVC